MLLEQLPGRKHSPVELAVSVTCSAEFHDMFSYPEDFCQIEIIKLQAARCAEAGEESG